MFNIDLMIFSEGLKPEEKSLFSFKIELLYYNDPVVFIRLALH